MTIASGARTRLVYIEEVTLGTTPGTPAMKVLRSTGMNINPTKNVLGSSEIRADRQIADERHGFSSVEGTIPFELSRAAYDDFLAAMFASAWAAVTITGSPDLAAASGTDVISGATATFIDDGLEAGHIITVAGFSDPANNGTMRVLSVDSETAITVDATLVTEAEAAGPSITVPGQTLKVGTTLTGLSIERQFLDLVQHQVFSGVALNTMSLSIQPDSIVGGTFGLLGMVAAAMSGTPLDADPTAAATNSPFSSFDGTLYEGGSTIAVATGLDIALDNGRSLEPVIGTSTSPSVFEGSLDVTGNLTVFFEDAVLLNKFVNETESSLWLKLDDINGTDFMNIVLPRVKYNGGAIDPPQEGPVPISLPIRALYDTTAATSIMLQRSNA